MTPPLEDVAAIYRAAIDNGAAPTVAVSEHWATARGNASRWISRARTAGLLPPTRQGAPNAYGGTHRPRKARWADGSESWLVCAVCRTPWGQCDRGSR